MTPGQKAISEKQKRAARIAATLARGNRDGTAKQKPCGDAMPLDAVILRDIQHIYEQVGKLGEWVGEIDRRTNPHTTASSEQMPGTLRQSIPLSPRASLLCDALDELQVQGNLLHDAISRLEDRLSPVTASRPTAPANEAKDRTGDSTVLGILHERILMVRGARNRIDTLLECVEV